MNVLERLGKSAENNHGLTLEPTQVREVVTVIQAMQMEIASQTVRADGVTRVAAVVLNELGGQVNIVPEMYADAEQYAVRAEWVYDEDDPESEVINVKLVKTEAAAFDVEVPEVQEASGAAASGDDDVVPLHSDSAGGRVDNRETDSDGEGS